METCTHPNLAGQRVNGYDADDGWLSYCPRCRLAWARGDVLLGRLELVPGQGFVLVRDETTRDGPRPG